MADSLKVITKDIFIKNIEALKISQPDLAEKVVEAKENIGI